MKSTKKPDGAAKQKRPQAILGNKPLHLPTLSMNNLRHELISFVLEKSHEQAVPKRIRLLKATASACGDESDSNTLLELARDLEAADLRCREFRFDFGKPTTDPQPYP